MQDSKEEYIKKLQEWVDSSRLQLPDNGNLVVVDDEDPITVELRYYGAVRKHEKKSE